MEKGKANGAYMRVFGKCQWDHLAALFVVWVGSVEIHWERIEEYNSS